MSKQEMVIALPKAIRQLWAAHRAVKNEFKETGLNFTLDGRLVGDIGEALAMRCFGLKPPERRTSGVDLLTLDGKKSVQVKATGKPDTGPAFGFGKGLESAGYLLFFALDFEANMATLIYNGPLAPMRAKLPPQWTGTKVVAFEDMRGLAAKVKTSERLVFRKDAPLVE